VRLGFLTGRGATKLGQVTAGERATFEVLDSIGEAGRFDAEAAGGKVFLLQVEFHADAVELGGDVAAGVVKFTVAVDLGLQLPVAKFLDGVGKGEEGSTGAA
jgi:hypothetical protein